MDETRGTREPVPIMNRDIPILTRVLFTMQDVRNTERRRQWQQDRLWAMTQKLTGMPGGHGKPDGLDAQFAAISEIEERYARECAEYVKELSEAEAILNAIPSRTMRAFVTMRYVLNMGRKEIMAQLNLKRWKYDDMCLRIEQAQDMEHVDWPERYILADDV